MIKQYFIGDLNTVEDVQKIFSYLGDELELVTAKNIDDSKFFSRRSELAKAASYNEAVISHAFMVINPLHGIGEQVINKNYHDLYVYIQKAYLIFCKFKVTLPQLVDGSGGITALLKNVKKELKSHQYRFIEYGFNEDYLVKLMIRIDDSFIELRERFMDEIPPEADFRDSLEKNFKDIRKLVVN